MVIGIWICSWLPIANQLNEFTKGVFEGTFFYPKFIKCHFYYKCQINTAVVNIESNNNYDIWRVIHKTLGYTHLLIKETSQMDLWQLGSYGQKTMAGVAIAPVMEKNDVNTHTTIL